MTAQAVEDFHEFPSAPGPVAAADQHGQEMRERRAGNVLHAQEPNAARLVDLLQEYLDDVSMFEAGQRPRLHSPVGRNLQGHETAKRNLAGQIDPGERPLAKDADQLEVVEAFAGAGRSGGKEPVLWEIVGRGCLKVGAETVRKSPSSASWSNAAVSASGGRETEAADRSTSSRPSVESKGDMGASPLPAIENQAAAGLDLFGSTGAFN